MNLKTLLAFAAILLLILGAVMIYLGFHAGIYPPQITGLGFIVIAIVFFRMRSK